MVKKAMEAAFEAAGYDTEQNRFHMSCLDALRQSHGNVARAADNLRDALIRYLASIKQDMDGKSLGGGHSPGDSQFNSAPAERPTVRDEAGQHTVDAPHSAARSSHPSGESGGHLRDGAQRPVAAAPRPSRGGAGRTRVDAHSVDARPAREPSVPKRGLAEMAGAVKRLHADFHIGALGMPFGDIRVQSLDRMIFAAGRERVLGRLAKAYVGRQARLPGDAARLREIIPEDVFGRMIAFAKHASMHGIEYLNDDVLLEQLEAFDV